MKKHDLFIKIIKKYSCSSLAISSIEKIFNINKKDYKELFKELSDNIENYIYLIPYDCPFDTERTFKNPMKIIIDPYKEKFILDIKYINYNFELESILAEFCNIAFRKFCFEYEILHLAMILLNFLYISENRSINSLNKELKPEGEIVFHHEPYIKDLIEKKDIIIQKDIGDMFEILCYGSIQEEFTLKQLLFIANENNDNLDYESFKKKYEEECKKNVSDLLNEFPDNQVLSDHVKRIKEYIDNNPKKISIENMLNKEILVTNDKTKENKDIYSLLNDKILVTEFERYDNHLIVEKRPNYNFNKKK